MLQELVAAVIFAPPLGAGLVAAQATAAIGTEIASNCVKNENAKEGLKHMSEVFYTGAAAGGAAAGATSGKSGSVTKKK